ncbi:hypothetical protein B0T20DRAFT_382919 [Sordaria brevicollis]|uniref:Uncharacterized protein n=1 Tax=Sordaria brevicollis TaxID=83679 RepID=A0AAE0P2S4_SORBR|nr:hypothetical protein B0T20DRAFT_382919 [Sordaria brevicollis]
MKGRSHLVHGWLTEAFPDEPVYSEALHAPEDVLYSGSEDEAYNSSTERRERYEEKGQRFLQEKPLFLLSASLRGPFTKESGWQNPWRSQPGRKRKSATDRTTATLAEEESIVIAATPTILESALRGGEKPSFVHEEEEEDSSSSSSPTPHRYLDDDVLDDIKTWQDGVAKEPSLDDPFDESDEPSSPDTAENAEVEITPRTHGSRSIIVSSSVVGQHDDDEDSVENDEDSARQDDEVSLGVNEQGEAEAIGVDDDDDSSLTELDDEEIEELSMEKEFENESKDNKISEEDSDNEEEAEDQPISASLPARPSSDYNSPSKRPTTSQPLPQSRGKLNFQRREQLEFLPADTVDLSPVAVQVFQESLRSNDFFSPSWRARERRKQGNLLPGLVDATLADGNAAQNPSSRSSRSMHASVLNSTLQHEGRTGENGSVTLDQQTIEYDPMSVDNQPPEPEETKDSPNQPSEVSGHRQQVTVPQPGSPSPITSATDLPQSDGHIIHTAPEPTDAEQKSHTTEPTSPSSTKLSSPVTSFQEEEEEEPIKEPVKNVRKLLWPKSRRQAAAQKSTPGKPPEIPSAAASDIQRGPPASQNGSVSASSEHHEGPDSLENFTADQQLRDEAAHNTLDSQSPSRFLQSQPLPEATVSEESVYDDTINQVRLEWPVEASSLPHQSQVQTQRSLAMESTQEPSIHHSRRQRVSPRKAKRIADVMDLRHITNPASRNTSPLRPSDSQKSPAKLLEVPVQVQPRPSATPEAPVNPSPRRSQLSLMASQALAQVIQPVTQQSPWAKGDSQITALPPAPEPRVFNPVSSPLSSPGSSSHFVDMEDSALPVASKPPVPDNEQQPTEENMAEQPARAQTPQAEAEAPHPPSTPETKRSSLPTPEFTMSIKSFKHFMTPSPQRPAKRPRFSLGDGRLPDTQALEEAVAANPWDSSRLEPGTAQRPEMMAATTRKRKRVTWAPLPGEADYFDPDMDIDMEDPDQPSSLNGTKNQRPRSILSTSALISYRTGVPRRAASPPPPTFSMPSVDALPKESQKFGKHFAAVSGRRRLAPRPLPPSTRGGGGGGGYNSNGTESHPTLRDVSGNARSTSSSSSSRLATTTTKRLLENESQQTCGSPAVDGMANAFLQADQGGRVENLRLSHQRDQISHTDTPLAGGGNGNGNAIWQDTPSPTHPTNPIPAPQHPSDNDNPPSQFPILPGLSSSQPPPDEVSEVLDNLDDFIDSWDIDEELAEARGEKTRKKNNRKVTRVGGTAGTGLGTGVDSGRSLWDSPGTKEQVKGVLKRGDARGNGEEGGGEEGNWEGGNGESQEGAQSGGGGGDGGRRGKGVYDPGVWDRIV